MKTQSLYKNKSARAILIRAFADSLVILFSSFISVLVIETNITFANITTKAISLSLLLIIVFIPIFRLFGIYTFVRNLDIKSKFIKLVTASFYALILLVLMFLVFNSYLSLDFTLQDFLFSDISIAWFLTILGTSFSRIWLYSYLSEETEQVSNLQSNNKVLVIGGAGYIGSALLPQLLDKGYDVKILDIFLFGKDPISDVIEHKNLEIIEGDFRKIDDLVVAISGCDALIHLGGIVGDPACSVDESLTKEVNLTASKIIGQIAKSAGVKKFIFASSCSVYGAQNSILNEESETKPLSLYAKTKIASERVLEDLSDQNFSPIFLRFGTVFGFSGRTRFDLVVNLLTANAFFKNKMTVFGKDQIRPFVHVNDAAKSIVCALEAKYDSQEKLVFNIGSNDLNITLFDLACRIQKYIPDSELIVEDGGDDARNYHVSFDKAHRLLKFKADWSLDEGITQVLEKLKNGQVTDYTSAHHSNVKHLHEEGLMVLNDEDSSSWEEMLLEESYS